METVSNSDKAIAPVLERKRANLFSAVFGVSSHSAVPARIIRSSSPQQRLSHLTQPWLPQRSGLNTACSGQYKRIQAAHPVRQGIGFARRLHCSIRDSAAMDVPDREGMLCENSLDGQHQ
jgi:hypothetical protein